MPSSRCFRITNNAGGEDGSDKQVDTNAKIAAAQQQCLNTGCNKLSGDDKIECENVCTGIFGDIDINETKSKCTDIYGNEQYRSYLINNKCDDGIQGCLKKSVGKIISSLKKVLSNPGSKCIWTKIHTTKGFNNECEENVKEGWLTCNEIKQIPANHCIDGGCRPDQKKTHCKTDCSDLSKDIESLKAQLSIADNNIKNIKSAETPKAIASKCTDARKKHAELTKQLRQKKLEQKKLEGRAGFRNTNDLDGSLYDMPSDPIIQLYYASIGLLMLYILMRVLNK